MLLGKPGCDERVLEDRGVDDRVVSQLGSDLKRYLHSLRPACRKVRQGLASMKRTSVSLMLILALVLANNAVPASYAEDQQLQSNSRSLAPRGTSQAERLTPAESRLPASQSVGMDEIIEYEMRGAFDFFWEQANTDSGSPGYGLVRDRYPGSEGISSIASVGFGLTAYLIGIEKGNISYQDGCTRTLGTLDTLLAMERVEGFYYHFVSMDTGKRAWDSEVSSIDTAILLMGVLSAGEYFGGEIEAKARTLYDTVNWPWFLDKSREMFYMAYLPEAGKGFVGHWDFYAEQLMLYVLAAGSDTYPVGQTPYYSFMRHYAAYQYGRYFIHSWFGSIFTYQFSHAWIDFRGYADAEGVNWFDNSVAASLAHYDFAVDMEQKYKTLGSDAWGLTACEGPDGYSGLYGAPPSGYDNRQHRVDDTVAPSGAIGSIVFIQEQALQAMQNYYSINSLKGEYGFLDAYNLSRAWFAKDVIGIDKGISLLMLANYQDDIVYRIMMGNASIQKGLASLQITKTEQLGILVPESAFLLNER